jgi:hypothetical protein
MDAPRHRRQRQAPVEARLRRALGGARRRFRDVRQGPFHQHADLRPHLRDPRRPRARALHLRALPRRSGPEDLEVQGQRPVDRRMADLCLDREPVLLHVSQAQDREAALVGRDPEGGGRIPPAAPRLPRPAVDQQLANPVWHIHGGHPPESKMVVPFAMLLNLASVSGPRTRTGSGASSAATRPTPRRKPTPTSTRRRASPCATTTTS